LKPFASTLTAAEEVMRLTNKQGVDVVIEHVGEATWARSVRALARGGRLVTCGATTGPAGCLDLAALFSKQLSIPGSYMGTTGDQQRLEAPGQFGKIVLDV
jgi:NADPH:quinone reductase-like Zn-dependent oxidoreductase